MNCNEAKEHLVDLLTGHVAEPAKLEAHLSQCPDCMEELNALKQVWHTMGQATAPEPGENLRAGFYTMLNAYKESVEAKQKYSLNGLLKTLHGFWLSQYMPRLVYSVCLLAMGVVTGYLLNGKNSPDKAYQQQISMLSGQMQEMRQIMLLSLIENPSASERLRAVGYTKDIHKVDDKVVEALLNTLNNDPNVNVRLVTIEALSELAANPRVREGLVQSLTKQESPLVQSALVDVMVMLQEKRSVNKLKQLLREENLNVLVKGKIEKSIRELS